MLMNDFVKFIFDHPDDCPEWYFDHQYVAPVWNFEETVLYTTMLFSDIETYLDRFTEVQLCSGLEYLINPSCGDLCYSFFDASVVESTRVTAIKSMYKVFDVVFKLRCSDALAHEAGSKIRPYNYLCYMWWHMLPRHGIPTSTAVSEVDSAILDTLKRILSLNSTPCKESALHGLGHWHGGYPEIVEATINQAGAQIPYILNSYAASAKVGHVQ